MKKVKVDPGVCGFVATVEATMTDNMGVNLKVKTGCEGIRNAVASLGEEPDPYAMCIQKGGSGTLYDAAREHCPHAACAVLSGIIKCVEVECGLALPKDAHITFEQ